MFKDLLRPAVGLLVLFTVLTGLAYPLAVTALAQALFPRQANGSLILRDGRPIGSALIGQPFDDPGYFWGRLSATGPFPYNAAASSGSNLGPTNDALIEAVQAQVDALRAADPGNDAPIPVDLATASGSGLDPHISPAAAEYQVSRVARVRGLEQAAVRALVVAHTEGRQAGILGEPRVNVLTLNIALDDERGDAPQVELPVAGELVGDRLVARAGNTVGVVHDALVDVDTGQLDFLVVELTIGGRRTIMERPELRFVLVPWSLVQTGGDERELRVDAESSRLYAAPRLAAPPDPDIIGWDSPARSYWQSDPAADGSR